MRREYLQVLAFSTWLCAPASFAQVIRVQLVRTADAEGNSEPWSLASEPRRHVFVLDEKRSVVQQIHKRGLEHDQIDATSIGGDVLFTPTVVKFEGSSVALFALGADNAVWYKFLKDDQWWPDQIVWAPAYGKFASPPVAVQTGKVVDVFAIGLDGHMYQRTYNMEANTWHPSTKDSWGNLDIFPWRDIGGDFQGVPAVASSGSRIDIVARGKDNELWHRAQVDSQWYPSHRWSAIGGETKHSPSITWLNSGVLEVVMVGLDGSIHHKTLSFPEGWSPSIKEWKARAGISFLHLP